MAMRIWILQSCITKPIARERNITEKFLEAVLPKHTHIHFISRFKNYICWLEINGVVYVLGNTTWGVKTCDAGKKKMVFFIVLNVIQIVYKILWFINFSDTVENTFSRFTG